MDYQINLWLVLWLLTAHTLADFFLQSNWMAIHKSKRLDALLLHVSVYSVTMALATWSLMFALVTFVAHLGVDWVTSRLSRARWPFVPFGEHTFYDADGTYSEPLWGVRFTRSRHWFFCTIGVDQWLHATQLLLTARWLL